MKIKDIITEAGFWSAVARGAMKQAGVNVSTPRSYAAQYQEPEPEAAETDTPQDDQPSQKTLHQIPGNANELSLEPTNKSQAPAPLVNPDSEVRVIADEPVVIKYKNDEFMLDNTGNWHNVKHPNKIISPGLIQRFDNAHDRSLGIDPLKKSNAQPKAANQMPVMAKQNKSKAFDNPEEVFIATADSRAPQGWSKVRMINGSDQQYRIVNNKFLQSWIDGGWKITSAAPQPSQPSQSQTAAKKPHYVMKNGKPVRVESKLWTPVRKKK